jgi:hypothetical protein
MATKIIACEVMKEELLAVVPMADVEFQFISMGLHKYPDKLRAELQTLLDDSAGYPRVVLAFGLCGGAARDLKPSGFTLTIPRVHDCIPLLLGSRERFDRLSKEEKGTFYYTRGWIDGMKKANGDQSILSEYKRIKEKFGELKAISVIKRMYAAYTRILYIKTGVPEDGACMRRSVEIAGLLDLRHEVTTGDPGYMGRIVNGPYDDQDFINVSPDGILDEAHFMSLGNMAPQFLG